MAENEQEEVGRFFGRITHPRPYLLSTRPKSDVVAEHKLRVSRVTKHAAFDSTLGHIGLAANVAARGGFSETLLVLPYEPSALEGIDVTTVRVFTWQQGALRPVWKSGINKAFGFVWAKISRPGTFVAIGLPRDRLLQESLRQLAYERRLGGRDEVGDEDEDLTGRYLQPFVDAPDEELAELRELLTRLEIDTGTRNAMLEAPQRQGGHPRAYPFPGGADPGAFRDRLGGLKVLPGGLPEEELFYPPELSSGDGIPWSVPPRPKPWPDPGSSIGRPRLDPSILEGWVFSEHWLEIIRWLFDKDWWMYQHDTRHTGRASGFSGITSTTVHRMEEHAVVSVAGPVLTKPSIVDGKVYVGSATWGGGDAAVLYKIDLASGNIEGRYPTSGIAYYGIKGIGGSPAITGGRVYFTTVYGKVICLDTASMTPSPPHPVPIWDTDLKNPSAAKNQPVDQGDCVGGPCADVWSGPLVVNGKVYVGCGEGEQEDTYGFVYCLDADNGRVEWLFCTSKFVNPDAAGSENQPNRIPASVAVSNPLPGWATAAGYSIVPDPAETGCAVWSSCAYDAGLNAIFVGTGNSEYPDTEQPDQRYGSGFISLDADTGDFLGFHQPEPDDSYYPDDADIDVPGSATLFTRAGQRVLAYGSKNGSLFLLDPSTMDVLGGGAQRRQLLPRQGGSGLPGDRGTALSSVVTPGAGENQWGIYGTPAIHTGLGIIYVGLGGRGAIGAGTGAVDKTPFLRALDWMTLQDAWPTAVGPDGVSRYTTASPPMYTSSETGLSSPAVVNDVVFACTHKSAMYALDAQTGLCLWSAASVSSLPSGHWILGPAVYGNYVVIGAGENVYIYRLRPLHFYPPFEIWDVFSRRLPEPPWPRPWPPWPERGPWPGPGPGPDPSPINEHRFKAE